MCAALSRPHSRYREQHVLAPGEPRVAQSGQLNWRELGPLAFRHRADSHFTTREKDASGLLPPRLRRPRAIAAPGDHLHVQEGFLALVASCFANKFYEALPYERNLRSGRLKFNPIRETFWPSGKVIPPRRLNLRPS